MYGKERAECLGRIGFITVSTFEDTDAHTRSHTNTRSGTLRIVMIYGTVGEIRLQSLAYELQEKLQAICQRYIPSVSQYFNAKLDRNGEEIFFGHLKPFQAI